MNALFRLIVRIRVFLLFILLETIALVLLSNSSYYQHAKIVNVIRVCKHKADAQLYSWNYYFSLKEVNKQLAIENNALRNRLEQYEAIILNDTLAFREVLDTVGKPLYSYIPAIVSTNTVSDLHNYITLNTGTNKGAAIGMGVVVNNGLVGTVVDVSEHYALVKSLLNVDWRVSAKLATNGAFGSMYWDGKNYREVLLTEIPQHIPVNIGDTIVSSGYSAMFPPEIPIGVVKSHTIKRGNFYEITVTLFADFKQLHYVDIVNHLYSNEVKSIEEAGSHYE